MTDQDEKESDPVVTCDNCGADIYNEATAEWGNLLCDQCLYYTEIGGEG